MALGFRIHPALKYGRATLGLKTTSLTVSEHGRWEHASFARSFRMSTPLLSFLSFVLSMWIVL